MWKQRQQLKRQEVLEERAHAMRHQPTPSEEALWQAIRHSQLGVSFKRQFPIGNYIADFAAPGVKLVIEVDGGSHIGRVTVDARKDRALVRLGYRVLRLPAELVLGQLPVAVECVRLALANPT